MLANLPDDEMYRLLDMAGPEQQGEVRRFLAELPGIRTTRLAFNRGATFADAFVVATPLLARDGGFIAAISAAVDPSQGDRLDDLGDELKTSVAQLARATGSARPEPSPERSSATRCPAATDEAEFTTTLAPRSANACATARPIPAEEPVTTATRPFKSVRSLMARAGGTGWAGGPIR